MLDFLQGRKGAQSEEEEAKTKAKVTKRLPTYCKLELTEEHAERLLKVLQDSEDLTLYMNTKNGMKVLADSLFFNDFAIKVFNATLTNSEKLR